MEPQMTSSSRLNSSRGFTLIELLVIIGIIVLLATILLPMANQAYKQAARASTAADLQVICQALEAYKHDFGDYPRLDRVNNQNLNVTGASLLCWALVAPGPATSNDPLNPGDGADGPGFRLRGTSGNVKGPYLPPDRFRIGTAERMTGLIQPPGLANAGGSPTPARFNNSQDVLADRNYRPILYFPATPGAIISAAPNGFVAPAYSTSSSPSLFIYGDNDLYLHPPSGSQADLTRTTGKGWQVLSYRLGDANFNGMIDPGETPITTGPYLLWSAGPDGIFGNDDDVMSDGSQMQQVTGGLPPNIRP
jgi:type II secretory pathway pseudopilin PulG